MYVEVNDSSSPPAREKNILLERFNELLCLFINSNLSHTCQSLFFDSPLLIFLTWWCQTSFHFSSFEHRFLKNFSFTPKIIILKMVQELLFTAKKCVRNWGLKLRTQKKLFLHYLVDFQKSLTLFSIPFCLFCVNSVAFFCFNRRTIYFFAYSSHLLVLKCFTYSVATFFTMMSRSSNFVANQLHLNDAAYSLIVHKTRLSLQKHIWTHYACTYIFLS